jgi:hypothetical protein
VFFDVYLPDVPSCLELDGHDVSDMLVQHASPLAYTMSGYALVTSSLIERYGTVSWHADLPHLTRTRYTSRALFGRNYNLGLFRLYCQNRII